MATKCHKNQPNHKLMGFYNCIRHATNISALIRKHVKYFFNGDEGFLIIYIHWFKSDYTGLQNRGGPVQKIRLLFSKVFRCPEFKNDIRFGPTRHNFSLRGVEIPEYNRKCQNLRKNNLDLTENGRSWRKMDLKIGFSAQKQFRDGIPPLFFIIFCSGFSIFLFGGLFLWSVYKGKRPPKRKIEKS